MGKWILVTGCSSGIGRVTAKYLDSVGYNLVLLARRADALTVLSEELSNLSLVMPCDLCDLEEIGRVFEICKEKGIKFDGMVHCAGIGANVPVRGNIIAEMQNTMTTNFFSFIELCKYFGLRKYSNDGASIVAISSISPLTCLPGSCNYAASKSAVNTSVRVMAKEYMKRGLRINAILPGYVNTPLGPAEDDPVYLSQQPLGIIRAEYIAYMVEFLLSEKGRYITGTLIPISGGMNY